jgi:hypothetical protein
MKAKIWHNKLKRLRCFKIIEQEHNKSLHTHEANKQAPQSLQELQSPAKSLQLIRHKISWFRSQNYFLKNVDQHIKMNQVISWYTCNVSCKPSNAKNHLWSQLQEPMVLHPGNMATIMISKKKCIQHTHNETASNPFPNNQVWNRSTRNLQHIHRVVNY